MHDLFADAQTGRGVSTNLSSGIVRKYEELGALRSSKSRRIGRNGEKHERRRHGPRNLQRARGLTRQRSRGWPVSRWARRCSCIGAWQRTSAEQAHDIAFHLTDWSSDAAFVVAALLFPERFSADQLRETGTSFPTSFWTSVPWFERFASPESLLEPDGPLEAEAQRRLELALVGQVDEAAIAASRAMLGLAG
jgi:hypothetical protein